MRFLRPLIWLLCLAGLVLLGLRVRAYLARPPMVQTAWVQQQDVTRILALTGRVRPQLQAELRPLLSSTLVELTAQEGQEVRRGEVVARLDDRQARAARAQDAARLAELKERLGQAERDLRRSRELHKEGLIAAAQLEQDELSLQRNLQERQRLQDALAQQDARLEDYQVRAPFDGWVLRRPVDPGAIVSPSDLLYELGSRGLPWIEAEVDELYLPELSVGMEATVAHPGRRAESLQARVIYVGKRIDRLSGAALIRLQLLAQETEDPSISAEDLPAGLSLDLNLVIEQHNDALTLPREAVAGLGLGADSPWVLKVAQGTAQRLPVQVIDWPAPQLVLRSGLAAGDELVLQPNPELAGQEVRTADHSQRSAPANDS